MTYRPARMSFGIFLAPFHRIGQSPTLAIDRDIALIEHLDALGFDEAWIGEHHSAGWEIIADPGLIIAAVAPRTRSIRLGTGVTSLPYHHPLIVADRMVQLDHMTRGRAMLGVGPGSLTSDAYMMGIDPTAQRRRMSEALTAIVALLRGDAPVTMETDWFTLRDARLQVRPYSTPYLPIATAHMVSPAGPVTAGQFGTGLLSMGASMPGGIESLAQSWSWAEEAAAQHGAAVRRDDWRIVMPVHIAETREQALAEARIGGAAFNVEYFQETLGRTATPGTETVDSMVERRAAIVGTPDDAIEAIEGLLEITGGFGGFMALAHEWAGREATWRSYELWARYVAPYFQGQVQGPQASQRWVSAHRGDIFSPRSAVTRRAYDDAGIAVPDDLAQALARQQTATENEQSASRR